MNARAYLFYFLVIALALTLGKRARAGDDSAKRAALEVEVTSPDSKKAAVALYELGKLDDDDLRFASAVARFDASLARDPSHRFALRARNRGDTLRAHSEGDFAPYAELEKLRRDHVAARDPVALDKLVADANGFPPGLVRVEARMLAGDAFLVQGDHAKALSLLELVVGDPKVDPVLYHQASHELVDAYLTQEDPVSASRIASLPHEDPGLAKKITTWLRRKQARRYATIVLTLFAVLSLFEIARALRRGEGPVLAASLNRFAPLAVGFAFWIGAFGGILAAQYETGNQTPFVALAIAALPVFFLARAWGAAASNRSMGLRIARGLLTAGAITAIAFVVLASIGKGEYLGGFGL